MATSFGAFWGAFQGQYPALARGRSRQLARGRGVAGIFQPLRRRPGGLQRASPFGQRPFPARPADQQGRLSPSVRGDQIQAFPGGRRVGNGQSVIQPASQQGRQHFSGVE
ncbi:MAG: hypothetical protein R6X17_11840 [Candidatus Competibacteraceae bacterium]